MGKDERHELGTLAGTSSALAEPADGTVGARLELARSRLDAAEPFAVASMCRWEGGSQVNRTQSAIVLATIHVQAGEQRGLPRRVARTRGRGKSIARS